MCQNKIILNNIKDNDIVYHSILVVKGTVTNISSPEIELQIVLNRNKTINHNYLIKKNYEYQFISLVQLDYGENHFEFLFGDNTKTIKISRNLSKLEYKLVPIYIIVKGHTGKFQADDETKNSVEDACNRIKMGMGLIQSLYAEKMYESGFEKRTFRIEDECKVFHSDLDIKEAKKLNQNELWNYLARETFSKDLGNYENRKYVGFLSYTKFNGLNGKSYTYQNIFSNTEGYVAISTGGLALLGTGCLYSWSDNIDGVLSCLNNSKIVDITKLMDDSNYRKTYGGCYSTTLGSVCHEIGHLFDLGHTKNGIMGNEIDFINRFFNLSNITENLPNRVLCDQQIETQNKKMLSIQQPKFTKIKKPGIFLEKYHEQKNNDLVYFTDNCLITLNYHKWFNYKKNNKKLAKIKVDVIERKVLATEYSLKLVELRQPKIGMLINYWSFLEEKNVLEFIFPDDVNLKNVTIFVINENGDILKCDI